MLICLEGIDGSGKGTQAALLVERLRRKYGEDRVQMLSFPRYGQSFFANEVAAYLNGERGTLEQVDPRFAAMLFAGDRFEAKAALAAALEQNKIIICDRYVSSNTAHQGARLPLDQRDAFYQWNDTLEYEVYGLPRPDLTLLINTPPTVAWEMVAKKNQRDYTERKRDIQEAKADYLQEVYSVYCELAERGQWPVIECLEGKSIRSPENIGEDIWMFMRKFLSNK